MSRPTTTTLVVKINPNATPSNIVSSDTIVGSSISPHRRNPAA